MYMYMYIHTELCTIILNQHSTHIHVQCTSHVAQSTATSNRSFQVARGLWYPSNMQESTVQWELQLWCVLEKDPLPVVASAITGVSRANQTWSVRECVAKRHQSTTAEQLQWSLPVLAAYMGHTFVAVIERWLFNRDSNVCHYITSDLSRWL